MLRRRANAFRIMLVDDMDFLHITSMREVRKTVQCLINPLNDTRRNRRSVTCSGSLNCRFSSQSPNSGFVVNDAENPSTPSAQSMTPGRGICFSPTAILTMVFIIRQDLSAEFRPEDPARFIPASGHQYATFCCQVGVEFWKINVECPARRGRTQIDDLVAAIASVMNRVHHCRVRRTARENRIVHDLGSWRRSKQFRSNKRAMTGLFGFRRRPIPSLDKCDVFASMLSRIAHLVSITATESIGF